MSFSVVYLLSSYKVKEIYVWKDGMTKQHGKKVSEGSDLGKRFRGLVLQLFLKRINNYQMETAKPLCTFDQTSLNFSLTNPESGTWGETV